MTDQYGREDFTKNEKLKHTHTHTNNIVMELKFWSQVHEFKLQLCHLLEE